MPVDFVLSGYSDLAYASAVAIYVIAMLLHFAEYGFGKKQAMAAQRQAVMATAGGSSESVKSTAGTPSRDRSVPERLGGMGVALTALAALVHTASLLLRGLATGRAPWGNMYEFGSAICLAAVIAWLVVFYRQTHGMRKRASDTARLRGIGGFLLLPMLILLFLSGTVLYAKAAPLPPALQSYWILIHVSAIIVASGGLLFSGVVSVMYLLRARHENNPMGLARLGPRLPTTQALDRLAYRSTVFIFPVFTFAVIAGAIWAEAAWGRFWGWDPKETTTFIAWVVYAAYLHARATAGWRGVRAAWINIFGFAVMIFNLFFVNIVVSGLHSYAGL